MSSEIRRPFGLGLTKPFDKLRANGCGRRGVTAEPLPIRGIVPA